MKLQELTPDQIRNNSAREYNPSEWDKTISRFLKYGDVKFYIEVESPNSYDRFFAVYVADGIRFLGEVSYSSMLSSGGFTRIRIFTTGEVIPVLKNIAPVGANRVIMRKMTASDPNAIFTKAI